MPADGADIIRELFDAFTRRDVARVVALCDPDSEFWPAGTAEQTGRTEPYRGHAGIREYFADLAQVWEEFAIDPGALRAAGNGVVAFGTVHVRAVDAVASSQIPVIWVFRLRAGRVQSARVVATAAEAHAALGSREAS